MSEKHEASERGGREVCTDSEPRRKNHGRKAAVISLKPVYADLIFNQKKLFEYRKTLLTHPIDRLYIHVCGENPEQVQGVADVVFEVRSTVAMLWYLTHAGSGMSICSFFDYFKGCDFGCAYRLDNPSLLTKSIPLKDLGLKRAPQGISYAQE